MRVPLRPGELGDSGRPATVPETTSSWRFVDFLGGHLRRTLNGPPKNSQWPPSKNPQWAPASSRRTMTTASSPSS